MRRRLTLWLSLALATLAGCGDPPPAPDPLAPLVHQIQACDAHLATIDKKLDELLSRRFIIGRPQPTQQIDGLKSVLAGGPLDLQAALQDAFKLVIHLGHSKDEVIGFIQGHFATIFDKHITLPPITKGALKQKFLDDIRQDIDKLLSD